MKLALIITTVSGFVPQFEMNHVQILQKLGYEVHYASNFHIPHYGIDNRRLEGSGIIPHQIDFVRSPFRFGKNFRAYRQIQTLLKEIPFDLIHCHTPMGGVLGRLAVKSIRKKQIRVIYTAHGFHFFCGAPIWNWLLYYPIERWLARETDVLITINQEDYICAQRFRLRQGGKVWKVNGVGIDITSQYLNFAEQRKKREEMGLTKEEYVFLSVGELTKRKNHQVAIQAFAAIKELCKQKKVKYFICGEGPERKKLTKLIQRYDLEKIVTLLGYRSDIKELLAISNCFLFPSKQEGLPVAVMEAMAAGLPCICSDIRGNRDLVEQKELVKNQSRKEYQKQIMKALNRKKVRRNMEQYSTPFIEEIMTIIYQNKV